MRWFVLLAVLMGVYYFLMMSTVGTAMDQTMQLHERYADIAAQAEQISTEKTIYNR